MYNIIGADQKEYGPVSGDQIRQWINEGRLNRQTRIQAEGSATWMSLDSLPEFAASISAPLSVPPPVSGNTGNTGLNVIIPYKNIRALIAYYLAVFSLIPFVGIFLGLAALVLGILGLRFRNQNPAVGGTVHAWIGVMLGGLCGFGYLAVTIVVILTVMAKRH